MGIRVCENRPWLIRPRGTTGVGKLHQRALLFIVEGKTRRFSWSVERKVVAVLTIRTTLFALWRLPGEASHRQRADSADQSLRKYTHPLLLVSLSPNHKNDFVANALVIHDGSYCA
jgi:hypothetical protein